MLFGLISPAKDQNNLPPVLPIPHSAQTPQVQAKQPEALASEHGPSTSTQPHHEPTRREEKILPPTYDPTKTQINQFDIFIATNKERVTHTLPVFSWNTHLETMAKAKVRDMIDKQYFAHESPDGKNVDELAGQFGYTYSLVGENLAMGDFMSGQDIVTGWMNSPGHRANILKSQYTEIGIAVALGMSPEGRMMWYAVQEFGRPAPSCTPPNQTLTTAIAQQENTLSQLKRELDALNQMIHQTRDQDTYLQLVQEYNAKSDIHNANLTAIKPIISTYNSEVEKYNACIAQEEVIIKK